MKTKKDKIKKPNYERLPEIVTPLNGVGKPGLSAKLIMRTDKKALYYRWDKAYEVFRIRIEKAEEMFGKMYPEREVYPCNEDFGVSAWCYTDKELAVERYNAI